MKKKEKVKKVSKKEQVKEKVEFNPERFAEVISSCSKGEKGKSFRILKNDVLSVGGIKKLSADFIDDTIYILAEEYKIIMTNLKDSFVIQTLKQVKSAKKMLKSTLKQYN